MWTIKRDLGELFHNFFEIATVERGTLKLSLPSFQEWNTAWNIGTGVVQSAIYCLARSLKSSTFLLHDLALTEAIFRPPRPEVEAGL